MRFRRKLASGALAACTAVGLALTPSAATASNNSVQGCQPNATPLVYRYHLSGTGIGTWTQRCSGNYPLNSSGIVLEAGAWSGWITVGGSREKFCNYDLKWLNDRRVTRIEMSPTRVPGC
jgi:hypothetical protein